MFGFPGTWRIYLGVEAVDMRKHFDLAVGRGGAAPR